MYLQSYLELVEVDYQNKVLPLLMSYVTMYPTWSMLHLSVPFFGEYQEKCIHCINKKRNTIVNVGNECGIK